jgi:hypothetical protein
MSVRRTIYTGQDAMRTNFAKVHDLLQDLSAAGHISGKLSDVQLDNLTRLLVERGITLPEVGSIATQYSADTKVPLDVSLVGGETAVHYAMQVQQQYTDGRDTANAPNFAVRFPAEAELIIRRQTVGSLLLLQASNMAQFYENDYDSHFGRAFLAAVGAKTPPNLSPTQVCYAMLFATFYVLHHHIGILRHYTDTSSGAYIGVNFVYERKRSENKYVDDYTLTIDCRRMPYPQNTACRSAATILAHFIDSFEDMAYIDYYNRIVAPVQRGLNLFSIDKVVTLHADQGQSQQDV